MAKKKRKRTEAERARDAELDATIAQGREFVRRGFAELREKRGYDGLTPEFRAVVEGSARPAVMALGPYPWMAPRRHQTATP